MKVKAVASPEIFSTSNSYVIIDWLVNYNIYNNQNMFWVTWKIQSTPLWSIIYHISWKSTHNFLSYPANKQTVRQMMVKTITVPEVAEVN